MIDERSNVQMTSNVYPVVVDAGRIDMRRNAAFVSAISDCAALKRIVSMCYGAGSDFREMARYASALPGIHDWQLRKIEGCDECSLAEGDRPWGIRIENGTHIEVCRCDRRQCRHFTDCRREEEHGNAGHE